METDKKFQAMWLSPRPAGKLMRDIIHCVEMAKLEDVGEIVITVRGEEWNEGYQAGRASMQNTQVIIDEC